MKNKILIVVGSIVLVLLGYNMACYGMIKSDYDKKTRDIIGSYLQDDNYEFINVLNGDKDTIRVFVKSKKNYLQFILDRDTYQVREINNDIPAFIR